MRRRTGGFTLLEVMVTLLLVGLLMGLSTADYGALFSRTRLEAAGRRLGDHFAFAVSRAYTTGEYHTLLFDLEAGSCGLKPGRQDGEEPPLQEEVLGEGVLFTDIQVEEQTFTPPGILTVEISPLGVTNDLVINLHDEKERTLCLYLDALVQRVEYYEEHKLYAELQERD